MNKVAAKAKKSKPKQSQKKASVKVKKSAKTNVIPLRSKAEKKVSSPKPVEKSNPSPKVHPFSQFMKKNVGGASHSVQTQKLGSYSHYRKKAI